jgi:hypothetical protein
MAQQGGLMQTVRKQRAEQWAEHCRQREEAYRRALRLLATAIGWANAGAPFGLIGPGPRWRPKRTPEMVNQVTYQYCIDPEGDEVLTV